MRFDCFPFHKEFDVLECRLTELEDVPDLMHVLVEADVTHGGNTPKPLYFSEYEGDRFDRWKDRIHVVKASVLPEEVNAWSREHAQREWIRKGLEELGVKPDDIVFQSDVDEIPTADVVAYARPRGFVVCEQRLHCFAVDWLHPTPWRGTVCARYSDIGQMAAMRDARLTAPLILPGAGWHLSWLGGPEVAQAKMNAFCHPEILPEWNGRMDYCLTEGVHVDGTKMIPVDVDDTYPKWIVEGNAPDSWFRPR